MMHLVLLRGVIVRVLGLAMASAGEGKAGAQDMASE